MSLNKGY